MRAIVAVAILLQGSTVVAESQRARVIDAKGVEVELADVRAIYVAQGLWLSKTPEEATTSLFFTLVKPDEAKEQIELPFAKIRRFRYSPYAGPQSLEHFDVELTSGTVMSVAMARFRETDVGGKVVRTVPLKFFAFWNGEVPNGRGGSALLEFQYIVGMEAGSGPGERRITRADLRAIVFVQSGK